MTRTAVLICPGRGTYNKAELGYLARHHADKAALLAEFDAIRVQAGQEPVTALDAAPRFDGRKYTRGDVASALIYACTLADALSLADDIEVVAVTGNSMGWYSALAVGGALSASDGFRLSNTMGTLMQAHMIGGQLVYPFVDEDWRADPDRKAELLAQVSEIDAREGHALALSIDLGGMLVLAGNEAGLAAFESAVPVAQGRFPMRLPNHAAFHTALQDPVAQEGRARLREFLFGQPAKPLIDGRGAIWWPHATDTRALWDYTLGHQVVESYDFTRAVQVAAREFAPDLFIVTGPGDTLGGAVAQALVLDGWKGMRSKADFLRVQDETPLLVAMGRKDQRAQISG
ncbi:ACP S-malonyltransferase [Jhaorihella thermophila]|uniref:[acyl-carrier-protein] S-malonyltransferase n=1 Tax=Jhaorihella thermophila TaxID=488547 RepID=A0A1H5RQY2_9RHOB|nr:ACP S-malonyltransferase [Jhaorihella thermophila]SEF40762.1 Malonyl CoA-acyl carrier protein transacylase [Jhaorihella thermophila]